MKKLLMAAGIAASMFVYAASVPKNVILFIGDGMSMPQRMVADEFSRKAGNGPLAMNSLPYQATTRTCSANSLVTDSAAAATAIACGVKTINGYVGVDADGKSVESCAAVAKKSGLKVGICSTVTITHATPSGFYGHRNKRSDSYGLALDLARSGFDFFAGGGLDVTKKKDLNKHAEYEKCGDAYEFIAKQGYAIVTNRADFLALKKCDAKVFTRFTDGPLSFAIDAERKPDQPTIAEITKKAIEMLDNEKGFFLMVEGGRIDWAGHANDAATNLRDVLALDEAVRIALDFQSKNPDTLVVVTGDHETGGLSMGFIGTGYAMYMERLANQTMSVESFQDVVMKMFKGNKDLKFEDVADAMSKTFGFVLGADEEEQKKNPMALTKQEEKDLRKAFESDKQLFLHKIGENEKYDGEKKYKFAGVCRIVISHKSGLGWSSSHHTAMPVLTSAKGPGAEKFVGFIENTDISKTLKAFYK